MKIWLVLYIMGHLVASSDMTSHGMEYCINAANVMHEVMLNSEELVGQYGKTATFGCTRQKEKPKTN